MVAEFIGPFFIILVVGFMFFCAVISLAACAAGRDREEDTAAARAAVSKEARP